MAQRQPFYSTWWYLAAVLIGITVLAVGLAYWADWMWPEINNPP